MNKINLISVIIIALSISACKGSKNSSSENIPIIEPRDQIETSEVINRGVPVLIIYKTVADFYNNVPVIMNDDKTEIISYPSPSDIYYDLKLAKPFRLKNGYLLDNRGINENVAFLSYTYEEYANRESAPSLSDLKNNIKEKYPLKELIRCGSRNQWNNEVEELNKLIDAGFPGCDKITF